MPKYGPSGTGTSSCLGETPEAVEKERMETGQDLGRRPTQRRALAAPVSKGKCSLMPLIPATSPFLAAQRPPAHPPQPCTTPLLVQVEGLGGPGKEPLSHDHPPPREEPPWQKLWLLGTPAGCCPSRPRHAPHPSEAQLGAGTRREGPPRSPPAAGDAPGLWKMGTGISSDSPKNLFLPAFSGRRRKTNCQTPSYPSLGVGTCYRGSALPARRGPREATQLIPSAEQ